MAEGTNLGRKMKNNNVDDVLWHGDGEDVMVVGWLCGVCDEVEGSKTKASEQSLAQAAPLKTDDFFDKQHESS